MTVDDIEIQFGKTQIMFTYKGRFWKTNVNQKKLSPSFFVANVAPKERLPIQIRKQMVNIHDKYFKEVRAIRDILS